MNREHKTCGLPPKKKMSNCDCDCENWKNRRVEVVLQVVLLLATITTILPTATTTM